MIGEQKSCTRALDIVQTFIWVIIRGKHTCNIEECNFVESREKEDALVNQTFNISDLSYLLSKYLSVRNSVDFSGKLKDRHA